MFKIIDRNQSMSEAGKVKSRLISKSGNLSDFLENAGMSKEEKEAINEADRLADEYSDIKPDQLTISGKHLFHLKY